MRPDVVVGFGPCIQVSLQLLDGAVNLLLEHGAVELVENGPVEPLDDAVGLWALHFRARMVDVLDGEVKLIFMALGGTAIFGAPFREDRL